MIIGANKKQVIENIKKATEEERFNSKVEVNDPNLSDEEKMALVNRYLRNRHRIRYLLNNVIARTITAIVTKKVNVTTIIEGEENIPEIKNGAIITSNHFNPLDNTIVRCLVERTMKKRMLIVSQETNLGMKGFIGYLMNYSDIVPITSDHTYMKKYFPSILRRFLKHNKLILIYPEQEMWFNYKKPRPPKRGAYYYAAKFNVPIISCFVEMKELEEKENEEFHCVQYIMHVLKPIYPDLTMSVHESSVEMMKKDYEQKCAAYEEAYGIKLDYTFSESDIAGWIPEENR